LEDEAIPTRVIDELMGHQRSRRGELEGGSRIGAHYRHTTPEMAVRVVHAVNLRLTVTLQVAEAITQQNWTRAIGCSSEASCTWPRRHQGPNRWLAR
jgi:hypothetical protein